MPKLNKALGQHHLREGFSTRPLLDFLRPAGHRVLEIGPGGGALTAELMNRKASILAVEVDPKWAFALGPPDGGHLVVADAMNFAFGRLSKPTLATGNLPYNIATPLIRQIVHHWEVIPRAAFLIQREVAERLAAVPRTKAYGLLSVVVQVRAEVRLLGHLPPSAFRPPPKVESTFVGLTLKEPPASSIAMARMDDLLSAGFGQRRKTLLNSLGNRWGKPRIAHLLEHCGISKGARAEELETEQWVQMANDFAEVE